MQKRLAEQIVRSRQSSGDSRRAADDLEIADENGAIELGPVAEAPLDRDVDLVGHEIGQLHHGCQAKVDAGRPLTERSDAVQQVARRKVWTRIDVDPAPGGCPRDPADTLRELVETGLHVM